MAVKRAVSDLVENAIKYGHEARVSVVRWDSRVFVAVEDRGPGILPSQLSAVLLPFHRVDVPGSDRVNGAGLGLSIAQAIVEDHGGEVRLANRAEGGLKAKVILPI